MIISTCGFGSTGSSAVCDYLMECEGIQNFDAVEFTLSTMVDGLEDLEYHLMKRHTRLSSSIYAIQRFRKALYERSKEYSACTGVERSKINGLVNEYINSISLLEFTGYSPRIDDNSSEFVRHYLGESIIQHRVIPFMEKKKWLKKNIDFYPLCKVKASIAPPNFYEATKRFVLQLLTLLGCDLTKNIVLDQAFAGNDPAKSFPFFEDPYAIVVDRDPRDLFIFANKVLMSRGRFMPVKDVDDFIIYYRMMRDNQPYKQPQEKVIIIPFEEMVYDYEISSRKIDDFLGVTNKNRKSIFVPELSAANTNLIRKFPEFSEAVKKIETALPEYLFPFNKYGDKFNNTSGEMFFGKSPLNKQ